MGYLHMYAQWPITIHLCRHNLRTEPCPQGSAQNPSRSRSKTWFIFLFIFSPFNLFVAVVRGLAAVSGWRGLGWMLYVFLESSLWLGKGLAFGHALETNQPRGVYLAELSTPLMGSTIKYDRKIKIQFWLCVFSKMAFGLFGVRTQRRPGGQV